jgi:hypothetical protein
MYIIYHDADYLYHIPDGLYIHHPVENSAEPCLAGTVCHGLSSVLHCGEMQRGKEGVFMSDSFTFGTK